MVAACALLQFPRPCSDTRIYSHRTIPFAGCRQSLSVFLEGTGADGGQLSAIEMAFAWLKALLRKFKERTIKQRWGRIGALLDAFTPE